MKRNRVFLISKYDERVKNKAYVPQRGYIHNEFGIHKIGYCWVVTHLQTGLKCNYSDFNTLSEAKKYAESDELQDILKKAMSNNKSWHSEELSCYNMYIDKKFEGMEEYPELVKTFREFIEK